MIAGHGKKLRNQGRKLIAFGTLGVLFTNPLGAQKTQDSLSKPNSGTSIGFWQAGARKAPLKTRYGVKKDRSFYMTGLRWTKIISSGPKGRWEYTNDILPIVVATHTPFYRDTSFERLAKVSTHDGAIREVTEKVDSMIPYHRTVYGIGWVPLGIRYTTPRPSFAQLTLGASGGGIYFDRRMPDPKETRFNFTLDLSALITIPIYSKHRISAGYQFNHISNANTGRVNPGMNSSMWHFGYSIQR